MNELVPCTAAPSESFPSRLQRAGQNALCTADRFFPTLRGALLGPFLASVASGGPVTISPGSGRVRISACGSLIASDTLGELDLKRHAGVLLGPQLGEEFGDPAVDGPEPV